MAFRLDWKRSILMSIILIACIYALRAFIQDEEVVCIASIIIFVVVLVVGNLMFRKKR